MAVIRTILFTVSADATVSPAGKQYAGVQGDHNATCVRFALPPNLCTGYRFRIEYLDGAGGYATTDLLTLLDNAVSVLLPIGWTKNGGMGNIRLVASVLNGVKEEQIVYTLDGKLYFSGREQGTDTLQKEFKAGISHMLDGTIQASRDAVAAAATAATDAATATAKATAAEGAAATASEKASSATTSAATATTKANTAVSAATSAAASANTAVTHADRAYTEAERSKRYADSFSAEAGANGVTVDSNRAIQLRRNGVNLGAAAPLPPYPLATSAPLTLETTIATVQAAIDGLPKILQHTVIINVANGTNEALALNVTGFSGTGALLIRSKNNPDSNAAAKTLIIGGATITHCTLARVGFTGINFASDTLPNLIQVHTSSGYLHLSDCRMREGKSKFVPNGMQQKGLYAHENGSLEIRVESCLMQYLYYGLFIGSGSVANLDSNRFVSMSVAMMSASGDIYVENTQSFSSINSYYSTGTGLIVDIGMRTSLIPTKAEVASGYLPITGGRLRGDLYVNNYPVWDAFSLQQLSTSVTIRYRTSATLYLRRMGNLVTAFAQWMNLGDYDPSITSLGTLPFGYRPTACTVGVMVGDGGGVYATINFEQSGNISPGINAGSAFKGHICATWSIN